MREVLEVPVMALLEEIVPDVEKRVVPDVLKRVVPDVLKRVCASATIVQSVRSVINVRKEKTATVAKRAETKDDCGVFIALSPRKKVVE